MEVGILSKMVLFVIITSIIYHFLRKFINRIKTPYKKDLTGKIIIVTGSSAGIGKAAAKDLLANGATVVFANRNESKSMKVINDITGSDTLLKKRAIFIKIDLSSFKSVIDFHREFKKRFNGKLDYLVNNAGAFFTEYVKTEDNYESTWQVNHLSVVLLTSMLLECLSNSDDARIINIASDSHRVAKIGENFFDFNDKSFGMWAAYSSSKLGNVFMTGSLKTFFEENNLNIKTAALCPGFVNTDISDVTGKPWYLKLFYYSVLTPLTTLFSKTELSGAQTTLHLCYMDRSEFINGGYYSNCLIRKVGGPALNKENGKGIKENTKSELLKIEDFKTVSNENQLAKKFINQF